MEHNEKSLLTPQDTPQVTESVERLIRAVQRETGRAELLAALKLRDGRSFSAMYLNPAFIEITVPDKPTSRDSDTVALLPERRWPANSRNPTNELRLHRLESLELLYHAARRRRRLRRLP